MVPEKLKSVVTIAKTDKTKTFNLKVKTPFFMLFLNKPEYKFSKKTYHSLFEKEILDI